MTSIELTPRKKICCFTYFLTPKLNFSVCSKKTSRFSLNRLDYPTVVAYKLDFFRNVASENSREDLDIRNASIYVYIGRIRGFKPKSDSEI